MSLATASRLALQREAAPREARRAPQEPTAGQKAAAALQQLTAYFPAEALAIYVGLSGLFQQQQANADATKTLPWWIFFVAAAAILFFVWITYRPEGKTRWARFAWLVTFGWVSFVAYAMALPATPFLDLWDQAPKAGTAAAIVLAPTLPALATKLRLKFSWR